MFNVNKKDTRIPLASGSEARGFFQLSDDSGISKNVIIFEVDNSSSVHAANRKKDILFLGKRQNDKNSKRWILTQF